jgi:hypothetical protein
MGSAHNGHSWRRLVSACTAEALLLITVLAVGAPAGAAPDSSPTDGSTLLSSGNPAPTPPSAPQRKNLTPMSGDSPDNAATNAATSAAVRQARATGKPVTVDAVTTETTQVVAEPSGRLRMTENLQPVRARRGHGWVPVDTTLHRNADGTLSPAATGYATLTLSGGGNSPLATSSNASGSLSVSWPSPLPAPIVSGATAIYRSVLPGVDLTLTATDSGGFSEVLVVHDAAAATNPALSQLTLSTATTGGLHLHTVSGGALEADNAAGQALFIAPSPRMWDSSTPKATTAKTRNGKKLAATPAADPSTVGHTGLGATVKPVRVGVRGGALALTPDHGMLTDPGTRYPVYIDPTWNPHPVNGARLHFDEVKQGSPCDNQSYWDNATDAADDGNLGVGYQGWPGGCIGKDRAYYQMAVPSVLYGAHVLSATVNVTETYSSVCAGQPGDVSNESLYWSYAIGAGTNWDHQPSWISNITSASFGAACTSHPSNGFNVLSLVKSVAANHTSTFSFALVNTNSEANSDRNQFKRFNDNPNLQVEYNRVPNAPAAAGMSLVSNTTNIACATTTPYPYVGKTVSTTAPTMSAVASDPDGDLVQGTFVYWVDPSGTQTTVAGSTASSGQHTSKQIDQTFISGMTAGQVLDWKVRVSDGEDTSGWSPTCHVIVWPTAPDPPTVTSVNNTYPNTDDNGGIGAAAGTPGQFTFVTNGSPATSFVYELDEQPADVNPPADETVTATNNAATITLAPPAPGPHTLWVYARDAANNTSEWTSYNFTAANHQGSGTTYTSLANAIAASADANTAVTSDTNRGAGSADSATDSFSLQDLEAAGWQPGGTVTVDGATFTLPNFGNGQPDNLLSAGQTISLSGAHGSALVFLATSTDSHLAAPGPIAGDVTSPYVPADNAVTGTYCFDTSTYCPARGTITYTSGASAEPYYLTVPDWITGPDATAVVTLPHWNYAGGQYSAPYTPKIYAFAVPIQPGADISSITLPDVSSSIGPHADDALHIFGIAVRDTTAAPSAQTWTGAWSEPNEATYNDVVGTTVPNTFGDQNFRVNLNPTVTGSTARVKLSNALGTTPLTIDHTTIAAHTTNTLPGRPGFEPLPTLTTPVSLTFGGAQSVTIPAGGEIYSDPASISVTPGHELAVSFHLVNTVDYLPQHTDTSYTTFELVSPAGTGDHTADTSSSAYSSGTWGAFTDVVTDLDVATSNAPTTAVLGDGIINTWGDGVTTNRSAYPLNYTSVADLLATNLQTAGQASGVINAGIENNLILTDQPGNGGPDALSRLDRDILDQPNIGTVIVYQGLNDLLTGTSGDDLENTGYTTLLQQLQAWGINVVLTTLTPCDGYTACTRDLDTQRLDLNAALTNQTSFLPPIIDVIDTAAAVSTPDTTSTTDPPEQMLISTDDVGDHVNLNNAGNTTVAGAIPLTDILNNIPPTY